MSSEAPSPFAGPGRPRVLFLGSAPTLGDGAIGAAILGRVRRAWPEAQLHVLTGTPEFYAALPQAAGATFGPKPRLSPRPSFDGLGVRSALATARRLRALERRSESALPGDLAAELARAGYDRADVVIRQGGPQWNDRWLPRGAVRFHALRLAAASTHPDGTRRPVALLGQSFGPFEDGFDGSRLRDRVRRRLARRSLDRCRVIVARDEASPRALERLGVTGPTVLTATDPAILLEPEPCAASRRLADENTRDGRPSLGLSFRPLRDEYGALGGRQDAVHRILAEALDRVADRVRLVFLSTGGTEDERSLAAVVSHMEHDDAIHRVEPPTDPRHLAATYGALDALLTIRLHPMILAACGGTPSVSLAYDPKCRAFATRAGLDRYVRDYDDVTAAGLLESLDTLMGDLPGARRRLAERVEVLRAETGRALDRALALCRPAP